MVSHSSKRRSNGQNYETSEDEIMARVQNKLGALDASPFEELRSPDHLVSMRTVFVDGEQQGIWRASTIVDASVEACAAWDLHKMSREKMKSNRSSRVMVSSQTTINDHSAVVQRVQDIRVPGFKPREWVTANIWKWADEGTLKVFVESTDFEGVPVKKEYLRAAATNLFEYKELPPLGDVPQTQVTFVGQVDVGGNIPRKVADRGGVGTLMILSRMRKAFDKSAEIDAASSLRLASMIRAHDGDYTDEEIVDIDTGKDRLKMFERMKTKNLKTESPSTEAKVAFEDNDSHAWGRATTTVRAE